MLRLCDVMNVFVDFVMLLFITCYLQLFCALCKHWVTPNVRNVLSEHHRYSVILVR